MAHGNVHWTANFDEIQDFENDIRGRFGGRGFLSDGEFAVTSDPLGSPKAGLSEDLDILVSQEVNGSPIVTNWLICYAGRPLQRPQDGEPPPSQEFVAWHRKEVFHDPARQIPADSPPGHYSSKATCISKIPTHASFWGVMRIRMASHFSGAAGWTTLY